MRGRWLMAVLLVAAPLCAGAEMPASAKNWHVCATDYDCVVIPGICGEAAVNPQFETEARAYYAQQAAETKCPNIFWKPKTGAARCRLEACEIAMQPAN